MIAASFGHSVRCCMGRGGALRLAIALILSACCTPAMNCQILPPSAYNAENGGA